MSETSPRPSGCSPAGGHQARWGQRWARPLVGKVLRRKAGEGSGRVRRCVLGGGKEGGFQQRTCTGAPTARPAEARWPPSMGRGVPRGCRGGACPALPRGPPPPGLRPPAPPPPPREPCCREPPDIIRLVVFFAEGPMTPSRLPWQPGSVLSQLAVPGRWRHCAASVALVTGRGQQMWG